MAMLVTGRANETGVSSKASSCAEAVRPPRLRAIVAVRLPKRTTEPPPPHPTPTPPYLPTPLFSPPPPPPPPPPPHTHTDTHYPAKQHCNTFRIAENRSALTSDGRGAWGGGGGRKKRKNERPYQAPVSPSPFFFSFSAVDVTHCVRNLLNCVIPFFPNWPANVKAPMSSKDQIYY